MKSVSEIDPALRDELEQSAQIPGLTHSIAVWGVLVIPFLLISMISVNSVNASDTLGPGTQTISFDFAGRRRSYILHLPPQAAVPQPLPLILNFHGGGGNAANEEAYTLMDTSADDHGFIVVYPNGTGTEPNVFNWNAGGCCADAMRSAIDDVGFTRALLDDLGNRAHFDRSRVYATGISAGGMMAYRLGIELADRIAAIAPVDAVLFTNAIGPSRPVPLMAFNSVDDEIVPYAGGFWKGDQIDKEVHPLPYPSVDSTIARWRGFDKCPNDSRIGPELKGAEGTADATHSAAKYTWAPCARGSQVVLWKLAGTGHVWPGAFRFAQWPAGPSNRVISANEEMWSFFARFSLPP